MAALKLAIGNKNYSSWSMRPWLALRANEIPFVETVIPLYTDNPADKEQILSFSRAGKVPVLVDGDFALPESDAILWYLGEKYADAKLLPRFDGSVALLQARAQILRFCDVASTAIYPAYSDWWNATSSDDPAKRSPAAADAALAKITRALGVLAKTLASGAEHLVGAFSLADIANAAIVFSLKRRLQVDPLAGLERTRAWYERVTARPAWRAVTD